jgi:hypothetical protein
MRIPIYLNKHTVALIQVFTRCEQLEDLWVTDYPEYDEDPDTVAKKAAEQFIGQLQDHWTPRFLEALQDEIRIRLSDYVTPPES